MKSDRLIERFLDYISYDTQSSEEAEGCPSTPKQLDFARHLAESLEEMGLEDVEMDESGYIYATLPSNIPAEVPTIGFISHYDTSPDCSGANIRPRIVEHYDGGDIVLDAAEGIVTSPKMFPEMLDHVGEDLIVTDGHTLLGADDKAGIAEIVEAMAYLMEHPEISHGRIRVAFNPDEEIGAGAHLFDVEKFGAEWAYTMDGSEVGELEYENFNAASATIRIKGLNVHPGYAKDKMRNACLIATEFAREMPATEVPERTEGYEGFYHLTGIKATVEEATLSYIIRDHDRQRFEERKNFVADLAAVFEERYGEGVVTADIRDQYYNMKQQLEGKEHIIDIARRAIEEAGMECKVKAIRGGTDGAQLSFKGLPCPNIFAGGLNFHGRHEFVPIQSMQKAMQTVVNICKIVAE
ncbi:MAG: peptidase T [Bacteroidaceae bacterium]|nr:peptidase T [Bacteroidaceae bacterium]MBQ8937603.1 peptidase T [Bacteroidaceae bacterium]